MKTRRQDSNTPNFRCAPAAHKVRVASTPFRLTEFCTRCGGVVKPKLAEDLPGLHEMVAACTTCFKEFEQWTERHGIPVTIWDESGTLIGAFETTAVSGAAKVVTNRGRRTEYARSRPTVRR